MLKPRAGLATLVSWVAMVVVLILQAACGGSGGDSPPVAPPPAPLPADQIRVTEGLYRGEVQGDLLVLNGIPYAQPPTGNRRFKLPEAVPSFSFVKDAKAAGPVCAQERDGAFIGSEDCLTLNIWTPDKLGRFPIVVFIHGGGFTEGASSEALYDGSYLASRHDVVVVTLNYRLGVAGFLAHPLLSAESQDDVSGNYGLHDVVEALRWINANASAFGGDNSRTLVMGQSAGGVAVCMLLASPLSQGLMSAAGVLGAPCGMSMHLDLDTQEIPSALTVGSQLATALGCDTNANALQCLRDVSIESMVDAEAQMARITPHGLGVPPTLPNVDGVHFPAAPIDGVASGLYGDIPLLIGVNHDEASVFLTLALIANDGVYRIALNSLFGVQAQAVYDLYPTADFANAKEAYIQLISDINLACPAESMAHAASAGQSAFLYEFADLWPSGLSSLYGAFHGIELSYFFNAFDVYSIQPTTQDTDLALRLQEDWLGMVDGAPDNPSWPAYSRAAPGFMQYGDTGETSHTAYRDGRCAGLRNLGIVM